MGVGGSNMVQGVLNMSNLASRSTHRTYSKEKDRRELAKMVAVCGLPFFLLILVLFIIFENFITQIMKVFQEIQLKVIFLNIKKNILIFFVVYLLIMMVGYLLLLIWDVVLMVTIILHLLSIGLTMNVTCKKRILAYKYVEETKTGSYIASKVGSILQYYGKCDKIMSVTLDNTSNNLSAVDYLNIRLCPLIMVVFILSVPHMFII